MSDDDVEAWGYVRLSQEGRDASLEEQKQSIREYARDTDGLGLATTRNDGTNTSGFDTDREEYQLLRGKIADGEIDAVVVRDRARLSRDFDERLRLLTLFRSQNVELHVVEDRGKIDVQDVQTAAMECVHAAMDHVKKMAEIERAREAIQQRVERGDALGRPPLGLRYSDDGTEFVPDRKSGEFGDALDVIRLREEGESWRGIEEETGVNHSTARSVYERRERYLEHVDGGHAAAE